MGRENSARRGTRQKAVISESSALYCVAVMAGVGVWIGGRDPVWSNRVVVMEEVDGALFTEEVDGVEEAMEEDGVLRRCDVDVDVHAEEGVLMVGVLMERLLVERGVDNFNFLLVEDLEDFKVEVVEVVEVVVVEDGVLGGLEEEDMDRFFFFAVLFFFGVLSEDGGFFLFLVDDADDLEEDFVVVGVAGGGDGFLKTLPRTFGCGLATGVD